MHFHRESRHARPKNPGQQILLEREGTVWEGAGSKEPPSWLTQPEEALYDKPSLRRPALRWVTQRMAAISGMKL